jgi:LPS sulfotransferase NodH
MLTPARPAGPADSYLICATPRTGSSLLCGLLESTGVAGHPESYFRQPDERAWAARWGIASRPDGTLSYAEYVRAALAAGRTGNGVFAARIMWGTMDEVAGKLATVHPDLAGRDADLLRRAFGHTRFIYLRRRDAVAQAVSLLRAEQTGVWFETAQGAHEEPQQEPRFDFGEVRARVRLIGDHDAAWQEWFASTGVRPYPVVYEELAADPAGTTRGVLDFLGLELPAGRKIVVRHRRLADHLNTRWIDRYRAGDLGS